MNGGKLEDYADIHQFIDSTKNLCSDLLQKHRHRILYNLWTVNESFMPNKTG